MVVGTGDHDVGSVGVQSFCYLVAHHLGELVGQAD